MQSTRRPGRPPLDDEDESVLVSFRLPSAQYDALCERAKTERVTLSERLRRDVEQQFRTQK